MRIWYVVRPEIATFSRNEEELIGRRYIVNIRRCHTYLYGTTFDMFRDAETGRNLLFLEIKREIILQVRCSENR